MVLASRGRLWRLAPAVLPIALSACPQLLNDDFHELSQDASPPGAAEVPDAGVDASSSSGDAGGGTSTLPEPDAGNAGKTPLSDVQLALRAALVHRYRFDPGATLLDSVGAANAVSVGATFSGGAAVLAGTGSGQYIDLPNGLLSGLRNASFEVWVIWDVDDPTESTSSWQRIYDLGRNPTSVEGQQCELDADATALYLTPRTSGTSAGTLQLKCETCGETRLEAPSLPVGVQVQLSAVVDDDANQFSLYRDGVLVQSLPSSSSISLITNCSGRPAPCDWNNWLGRSQHIEDPPFQGRILDFRIYSAALSASLIQASFVAGPDADW
ncbi:MAG: LamG-like jellyroll fold domain-containing protein [Deltaproteobacteria bacterium]